MRFNHVVCIVLAIQMLALPTLILVYLCPNVKKLKKSRFIDKYGAIYDMIDLKHRNKSALLWPIFFLGRRSLFAIGVVVLKEHALFQIFLFIFPTLAVMIMVGLAKPLESPFENKHELYNNFSILLMSYSLLLFT